MSEVRPSDYLVFDAALAAGSSDTVVFTPSPVLNQDGLKDALRAYFDRRVPPNRVFVLATAVATEGLKEAAENAWVHDVLEGISGAFDESQVVPVAFDAQGGMDDLLGRACELGDADVIAAMMRSGLQAIFERNGGLLRSGPGYHFINPSGVHTTAFLRAGEVLRHSADVGFIAMQILRWWPQGLRHIFVDTAAISSVAYALIELRRAFEPDLVAPTIDSFSSYAGLESFQFRHGGLCLLSASISGGLEDLIREADVELAGIVTLFYGGKRLAKRRIVCDLVSREVGQAGIEEIGAYDEASCELCDAGQGVVRLSGDQFLPANPRVTSVMVRRDDAPAWLPEFLDVIVGYGAAGCHVATPTARRDLHLELKEDGALKVGTPLATRLDRHLIPALPAALTTIIHTEDEPSRQLAQRVAECYHKATGRSLDPDAIISESAAARAEEPVADGAEAIAVVSTVAATGRALLRISLILRRGKGAKAIVYLLGVSRLLDVAERRRIENNLSQADWQGRFRVVTAAQALLPRRPSPWDLERRFLEGLEHQLKAAGDGDAAAAVQERLDQLAPEAGLVNDVFLPSIEGGRLAFGGSGRLRLGQGFVYWPRIKSPQYGLGTQADVYLTISAVLHGLRTGQGDQPPLIQHEHNRTVLAPANFARYTDGIIQAALLRATEPRELSFDCELELSGEMFDIISTMLGQPEHEASAALPELLLALALGHVSLAGRHLRDLAATLAGMDLPPFLSALRLRIAHHAGETP